MCYYVKEETFLPGTNLITGEIGSGKSTLILAIYFCLYGGTKFRDIANDNHKNDRTEVSFHFYSPNKEYIIKRTRPSERVTIDIRIDQTVYNLFSDSAQNYINSIFGTEDNFIASSLISQKKGHFLMESGNSDKISLLQQITFGDLSLYNQVDPYTNKLKLNNSIMSENLKQLNNQMLIQIGILNDIVKRNPEIDFSKNITHEYITEIKNQLELHSNELTRLNSILPKVKITKDIKNQIRILKDNSISESFESLQYNISQQENAYFKELYQIELIEFNIDVLKYTPQLINSCNEMYKNYIQHGYNPKEKSIEDFIEENKKQQFLYDEYCKKKADELKYIEENRIRQEYNKKQIDDYNKIKIKHDESVVKYNSFIEEKNNIVKMLEKFNTSFLFNNLNELNSYIISFNSYIKNELEKEIYKMDLIKKIIELKNQLHDFDSDCISCDQTVLLSDIKRYEKLVELNWNIQNDPNEFIDKEKRKNELYNEFLSNVEKYKYIQNNNKIKEQLNLSLKNQYEQELILYKKQQDNYKRQQDLINELQEKKQKLQLQLNNIKLSLLDDKDDYSVIYCSNLIKKYTELINQHICPNCSFGLIIKNGILLKGTITLEEKIKYSELINLYKDELNLREKFNFISLQIENIIIPENTIQLINEPVLPQYQEYEELPVLYQVENSKLNDYTYPTFSYNKVLSLKKSMNKINIYNELKLLETKLIDNNIDLIFDKIKYNVCNKIYNNIKSTYNCNKLEKIPILNSDNKIVLVEVSNELDLNYYISNYDNIIIQLKNEQNILNNFLQLQNKLQLYDDKLAPHIYELIEYPKLLEITNIELVVEVKKPKLEILIIPELSYDNTMSYIKSLPLIDKYNKFNEITTEIKFNQNEYTRLKTLLENKKLCENKMQELEKMLLQYNIEDNIEDNIENNINSVTVIINNLKVELSQYEIYKHYYEILFTYNEIKKNFDLISKKCEKNDKLLKHIEELGRKSLQEKLDEVNCSLKIILDSLFNNTIEVELTSQKEFKNGKVKFEITFNVIYKGVNIQKMDRLSGGEQNIVAIALILAFSRLNSNPLIMLDEIMAFLDENMRDKCMKIINAWTVDKFVLHICHEISTAYHNNIISVKKDPDIN